MGASQVQDAPLGGLGVREGLGGGGSTEQGGSAAEASDGEGAPVRIGRGETGVGAKGVQGAPLGAWNRG